MRLEVDIVTLNTILNSKTLSKILYRILGAYMAVELTCESADGIKFSMEDLRKSLRYKNKSTVSRGLKALADLGLFNLKSTNQGTIIDFNPERIRRVK